MRKFAISLFTLSFLCLSAHAMSTWQNDNSDLRGYSYEGTSGAEGYRCVVNDGLNGRPSGVRLFDNRGLIASQPYDESLSPGDNCSDIYTFSN